ncbi:MAG: glycosyltransferase [Acidimicrobiales bacterium]|nr:glycosyltransferase [Acidimicrobiales bacterium]
MILVTVGAQMPFPRLVDAVDDWAAAHPDADVFAQIGDQVPVPTHLAHVPLVDPLELRTRIEDAELVVAHAGMGTIITCLELGAPLVIFAREGARRETRNDHQVATARHFGDRPGIWVAASIADLHDLIDRRDALRAQTPTAPETSPRLLDTIRDFIDA